MTAKTLKIRTRDAVLVGDLYLPKSNANKKSAIIIEPGITLNRHGLFKEFAEFFSDNGMQAFVYDRRSHGESTGKFRCESLKHDLISVIRELKTEHKINKIGLFGFCYGGITAMEVTPFSPEVKVFCGVATYPKCLPLALNPKNGLPFKARLLLKWANRLYKIGLLKYIPLKTRDFHVAPQTQSVGYRGDMIKLFTELACCKDCMDSIRKIKKPFFLFRGLEDEFVPQETIQMMYDACPSKTKKIYTYPGADHLFMTQRKNMLRDCLEVCKRYLR